MANQNANWRIVGASAQGASHQKTDTPCQDAHGFFAGNDGLLFAAVSDGAGSALYAEEAARLAATAVLALYQGYLPENSDEALHFLMLSMILEATRDQLLRHAEARRVKVREFSCTLLLVLAHPEWIAAAQVGDGAVVVEDESGNIFALTKPQTGEHANETVFLVSPDALNQAEFVYWQGAIKNIALFTDGLQRLALKMPEGSAHAPFFAPLFRFVAKTENEAEAKSQLETFLRSPRIAERADDDLTLLLAHRIV